MAKGSPSMIALLGMLAVAGYANRDKLSGMMQGASDRLGADDPRDGSTRAGQDSPGQGGGLLDSLQRALSGNGASGGLAGGLSELLSRFTNPVQSAKARTWVDTGPNGTLEPQDLEQALDDDTLAELSEKTGLSRSELLTRLSQTLPDAVDQMTPNGRLPTPDEARAIY